jgi:hypothetical protein
VATRDPAAAANSAVVAAASDNPFGDAFENIEITSEQARRDRELMEDISKGFYIHSEIIFSTY